MHKHIGILGDIHGDFDTVTRIMQENTHIEHWLCVGDLGMDLGNYFTPPKPLYYIHGNHDDFELLESIENDIINIPTLRHIKNTEIIEVSGLKILGLGGNYSPNYYKYKSRDLPGAKKRHYTREEIEKCKRHKNVDILLTHEAPSPFINRYNEDVGRPEVTSIISSVKPKLHFSGHHHIYREQELVEGTTSISLDYPRDSWVEANTKLEYELKTTTPSEVRNSSPDPPYQS